MKIVPYNRTMLTDVIALCIRCFPNQSIDDSEKWENIINRITSYQWLNRIEVEEFPYRNGMVLMNDRGGIHGFLGLIFSKQTQEGHEYICVNATTLVIDKEYGFYMMNMISKMHEMADIVMDFSPIKPLRDSLKKYLNYESIENCYYSFYPMPTLCKSEVKIRLVKHEKDIKDLLSKNKYSDHKKYGVQCLEISGIGEKGYIFYKDETIKKGLLKLKISHVLDVSDQRIISKSILKVVWFLFIHNNSFMISDMRFLGELRESHFIKRHYCERLVFSRDRIPETISLLYTEIPIILF